METVTIHENGTDSGPASVSLEAEVLANGTMRLSAAPEFDGSFSHAGVEYAVAAGSDLARPLPGR